MKRYRVELTAEQREELSHLISTGRAAARELTHARILLKADQGSHGPGWSDQEIAEALECSPQTVARVRKHCATRGVQEAILPVQASRVRRRRLDGTQEAYLIALACSAPPDGYKRWTLRLLASQLGELGYVETISHETVRQVLLSNELKPWLKKQWCIPTQADAEFVYRMEDVLEVYTRPYDPRRPQVCMDEINTQLLANAHEPLPMEPGQPKREDYEYVREGVCNVFLACEPLAGKRYTMVAENRTKQEWAQFIRTLSDEHYLGADKIVLVMDNLNTHTLAALYEVFPIAEARRLCQRFEVHYPPSTPVGSTWPRLSSRLWIDNACRNAWPHWRSLRGRSPLGPLDATNSKLPSVGALLLRMRPSNSSIFTHQYWIDRGLEGLRFIGTISYSIYLWHVPILIFLLPFYTSYLRFVLVSVVVSSLSVQSVESGIHATLHR